MCWAMITRPNILLVLVSNMILSGMPSCTWTFCIKESCFLFFSFQAERDGSNEYNNYQPGSLNTTDQLIRDLKNIDIVFHIGDICYANGYLSQWDQFTSQVEPIASTVPYMIARLVFLVLISIIPLWLTLLSVIFYLLMDGGTMLIVTIDVKM